MHTEAQTMALSDSNPLRLVNGSCTMMQSNHSENTHDQFSDTLDRDDPRWLLAVRVQIALNGSNRIHSAQALSRLIDIGIRLGFTKMEARAIVGVAEEAQLRDGLDRFAMLELLKIEKPALHAEHELSTRARWIAFGVLFSWALMVCCFMQLV